MSLKHACPVCGGPNLQISSDPETAGHVGECLACGHKGNLVEFAAAGAVVDYARAATPEEVTAVLGQPAAIGEFFLKEDALKAFEVFEKLNKPGREVSVVPSKHNARGFAVTVKAGDLYFPTFEFYNEATADSMAETVETVLAGGGE